jgi:ribosomal protein S18 acetylase RimI-like enzyme
MALPPDAPDLARMHVESWRESYPGLVPEAMLAALSVDARSAAWRRILGEPAQAAGVFVAELDGRIVGFGSCGAQRAESLRAKGYEGEISALYVLKAFQRRALGTRLLFRMAFRLQVSGFEAASLWVLRDNVPARRFYERCGGELLGEREDVRPQGTLHEVAYGWPAVARMLRITGDLIAACAPAP